MRKKFLKNLFNKKSLARSLFSSSAILVVSFAVTLVTFAAWSSPTQTPPLGNTDAPITVNTTPQTIAGNKTLTIGAGGALTINGLFDTTGITKLGPSRLVINQNPFSVPAGGTLMTDPEGLVVTASGGSLGFSAGGGDFIASTHDNIILTYNSTLTLGTSDFFIRNNTTNVLVINDADNVGIGLGNGVSPTGVLDVGGNNFKLGINSASSRVINNTGTDLILKPPTDNTGLVSIADGDTPNALQFEVGGNATITSATGATSGTGRIVFQTLNSGGSGYSPRLTIESGLDGGDVIANSGLYSLNPGWPAGPINPSTGLPIWPAQVPFRAPVVIGGTANNSPVILIRQHPLDVNLPDNILCPPPYKFTQYECYSSGSSGCPTPRGAYSSSAALAPAGHHIHICYLTAD